HVRKRSCPRSKNLAHRVARHLQRAHDLLDRLAPDKVLPPDPADRLHNQHPPPPARVPKRVSLHITAQRGSQLDADHPSIRVNLPRRNTFLSRLFTALNLLPSIAITARTNRLSW